MKTNLVLAGALCALMATGAEWDESWQISPSDQSGKVEFRIERRKAGSRSNWSRDVELSKFRGLQTGANGPVKFEYVTDAATFACEGQIYKGRGNGTFTLRPNPQYSAELVKNSLEAGAWELMLYTYERGEKTLYYQGWFSFPLGHYKRLFEKNTGLSYWKHFYYLEHRGSAEGQQVKLDELRTVSREAESRCVHDRNERVFAAGEQARRRPWRPAAASTFRRARTTAERC